MDINSPHTAATSSALSRSLKGQPGPPKLEARQRPPKVPLRGSVYFCHPCPCLLQKSQPAMFSLACTWVWVGAGERVARGHLTHLATPRRKTTEFGWHILLLSVFGDKVRAIHSQKTEKDSLNVGEEAGLWEESGETAKELALPS